MIHRRMSLWLSIFVLALSISCSTQKEKSVLHINTYLQEANPDLIHPTPAQIEMLKKVIPNKAFQPAPSLYDRAYWDRVGSLSSGQAYVRAAMESFDKAPEVPISDEIYRRANLEGNRPIYKPRYYRTMQRLEEFIIAECIENKGHFIPQIEVYIDSIMAMKSWLHPNHDDDENTVLEGKRVSIDLGARKFGLVLALADALLEDKLSEQTRRNIAGHLQWRITDSYLQSCRGEDKIRSNTWIRSTSNWNSVCNSGTVFTTIVSSDSYEKRINTIGCALNSMVYYLSGFGDDGYCSEGTGYWRYGFGHYLYLAEILYDYSNGSINLFEFNNPEKLKNVAHFPERFLLNDGMYAPFSDGVTRVKAGEDNFAYLMCAKYYNAQKPTEFISDEAVQSIIGWSGLEAFIADSKDQKTLPSYTYFDDQGIVISRGSQNKPLSIAIKAGHNAENHNHMDVGSYVLVYGEEYLAGDIGAPSYRAGAFSNDNPARSSWGHPLPRINNQLQKPGKEFAGKVLETEFGETSDKVVMDIRSAYDVEELTQLQRTMSNDKTNYGSITIIDEFKADSPINIGTAISTFSNIEMVDAKSFILTGVHFNEKVRVEIESQGGDLKINTEPVPVEHLRSGKNAKRIGIDFIKPIEEGSITVRYFPVN